ncbi:MAG: chemotaxis protein CheW [Stenotrophomonas sp.]|uniref:chemotaxis protein CheW n=1 Tax=Stenotrophomonas sp. TaxID=69392 RepID=UPI0028A77A48|nr:chemotaxis protein CheW [Stenotrophomonas sp.]
MSNDVLDDYLGELLLEAVPAAAVAAPATPAKPAVVEVPGDSPELEAVFEAALAEAQAKPAATPAPVTATMPSGDTAALQAAFDDALAATTAANAGRPPTWDDLPDEVIYETGPAESRKLAHSDSASLQAAFETAAGLPASPAPPPRSTPNVRALDPPSADARPSTWQELQAQAQRPASSPQQRRAAERSSRWLRLRCGQQTYALELLKVQEVVLPVPLLALRGTGPSMLGIMNLRGQVVPVMDLCRHLDVQSAPEDSQTRIVVLEENGETLGLRVSAVEDVANLNDSQIEPPDTARICQISNELFRGIARVGQQPMILLDAGRLLR